MNRRRPTYCGVCRYPVRYSKANKRWLHKYSVRNSHRISIVYQRVNK